MINRAQNDEVTEPPTAPELTPEELAKRHAAAYREGSLVQQPAVTFQSGWRIGPGRVLEINQ